MGLSESCRCSGTSPSPGGTELDKSRRPGPRGLRVRPGGLDGLEVLTEEIRLSWVQGMAPPSPGDPNGKELVCQCRRCKR